MSEEAKKVSVADWYENKQGRKFRGTELLASHAAELGLKPTSAPKPKAASK